MTSLCTSCYSPSDVLTWDELGISTGSIFPVPCSCLLGEGCNNHCAVPLDKQPLVGQEEKLQGIIINGLNSGSENVFSIRDEEP